MQGEESETSSSVDVQVSSLGGGSGGGGGGGGAGAGDKRGKHRILAELKRLEQETRSLEEELEELERMNPVSVSCEELLLKIETRPDPLLPVTNGPPNPSWDRWFEGPQESRGCRCWVL